VAQGVGRGIVLLFHDRGTRRGWVVSSTPRPPLPPGKTRNTFYGRLGGPQGRSGRAENLFPTGIRSRTVQPVVSRYTDWATRPTRNILYRFHNTQRDGLSKKTVRLFSKGLQQSTRKPPSNCGINVILRDEAPIHEQDHLRVPYSAGCYRTIIRTFLVTVLAQCREGTKYKWISHKSKKKPRFAHVQEYCLEHVWISGGKAPLFLWH